ncbi:thioesterase domain-containing protein [Xanthobacter pseudotagetidis]|uniref:thioesterase domain-containing protein n=1 Tax=Xanthobacter pseudotagetidis TaxID=3119911 RepID=UPI00372899D0
MMSALRHASALIVALFLSVSFATGPAAAQNTGHVYLLRGLANVFSLGMDDLAEKLNARGITATVHEYGAWPQLADQAAAASRANRNAPIIIVGHSLGADAAIEMAQRLTALGVAPRLVVTFDPVGVTSIGPSGGRFVNYYQSNNGYGKRLATGPGFKGRLDNRNLDASGSIDHFNIEKSPRLHSEVIAAVQAITARPKPRPRPVEPAQAKPEAASPGAANAIAPAVTGSAKPL